MKKFIAIIALVFVSATADAATRFYLPSSGSAPASPAYDTNWEYTTGVTRLPLPTAKSNTALTTKQWTWDGANTHQALYWQFVSDTLDVAQSISGTISMVVGKCAQTTTSGDTHLAFSARVVNGAGATRCTLLLYHATSTEYAVMASAATRIHSARAITTCSTAAAGDRIVMEIGLHGVTPAVELTQMRIGDPTAAADFALTAGLTTDLDPWIELSQTITFGAPPAATTSVMIVD